MTPRKVPNSPPVSELRASLLRWYDREARDLPWRRTSDPYRIWVSEVMLQQTRVTTVIPYYDRFLRRFPDARSLAKAKEEEVLGLWSGLGYYRRARSLLAGAQAVMERHDGEVPRDPAALRKLPGVGRYTAGAIASICFDLEEPILDGNVRRVLARIFAVDGERLGRATEEKTLWAHATAIVQGERPGDLNQSLMELGALLCTPTAPDCPDCPARKLCRARLAGSPESYPAARPRAATVPVSACVALVRRADRLLLERPGPASPLRGLWDLPALELKPGLDPLAALQAHMARTHGLELDVGQPVAQITHGIMNRRITLSVHPCRHKRGQTAKNPDVRWIQVDGLAEAAVSGATHKVLRAGSPGIC